MYFDHTSLYFIKKVKIKVHFIMTTFWKNEMK